MAVVIFHPEHGVYLGNALGFGYWSTQAPFASMAATCFDDADEARDHVALWGWFDFQRDALRYVVVEADVESGRGASICACLRAGLPGWLHPHMECAGTVH